LQLKLNVKIDLIYEKMKNPVEFLEQDISKNT
jgi:hypothetical protein